MRVQMGLAIALLFSSCVRADDTDMPWEIHGQIVDEQGKPVEDLEASTFWLSNGNWWNEKGELLEEAKGGKLWTNEGVLASNPKDRVERLQKGRFNLTVDGDPRQAIYAIDASHERGGIVFIEQSAAATPVTIKLVPLVRVIGKVYCSEAAKTPEWTNVTVYVPGVNGSQKKLMICGSFRGQFSFLLPPGKYDLDVYSQRPIAGLPKQKQMESSVPGSRHLRQVEIPSDKPTMDLGTIDIVLPRDKEGTPRDLTNYYGKVPPELSITDARGALKTVKLADFRGKWVVLDFWNVGCGPCVERSLPEMTKFVEGHSADRNRFEILAICNTEADKAFTVAEYDVLAAPLVKDVWGGKQLPFPVLIDGEGKPSGSYGIKFLPTVLLIGPDGHLVDVDENNLMTKLEAELH